ncbi:MAG: exo-alpha-sialidase [Thermoguttaceae bacterium]|nr:exo-alpha-sialidase [Thermoguttaceae bacterium]
MTPMPIRVKFAILSALAALLCVTVSAAEIVQSEFVYPLDGGPTPSCHASTIVETPEGTLVAAWFGGSAEGKDDVCIWLSRREKQDRGADKEGGWSAPVRVAIGEENGEQVPCWNPVLFQWQDGPLVLFYKVGRNIDWWRGEMLVSSDDGKTGGEKQRLPEFFVGPVKNKPVQLADGSLLAGSSMEDGFWRVHVETTPGFGKTWSRSAALHTQQEGEAIQPTILTYADGRIQLLCRTDNGRSGKIWQFWSEDGGKSWGKMLPTDLPNPCSGIDAVSLSDGRQLLVYNPTNSATGGRAILTTATSTDGEHWSELINLERHDGGEYSYPSVIQSADGHVHILYTWQRRAIRHVDLVP